GTGSLAMPAVQERSDAADRCSMPVLAEAFLSPSSMQKSVSTQLPQRKGCLYHSGDAVFLGFTHCKTHPACFSHLYSFPSPILFRTPLTILRPSKTHSSRHAAAA